MNNENRFKIENTEIAFLERSIKSSGYPKRVEDDYEGLEDTDYRRAAILGKAKPGSGHDNYLKGIVVAFDVTAPSYWWPQFQRYHFADIVSSQSKMHMLTKFNIREQLNGVVWNETIYRLERLCERYNNEDDSLVRKGLFDEILNNTPLGFHLKADIRTNYLQLKTIIKQRKGHKLDKEWGTFINWVHDLPRFNELTGIEQNKTHD